MHGPGLSRRGALFGATCMACSAGAAQAESGRRQPECTDLTATPPVPLTPVEQETHSIFLLLAMALVFDGWGVDQRRPEQLAAYAAEEPGRRFADYLGHNIGALLVDRASRIVCFALNRNVEYNSTLEHAEARSVRAGIQIANAARPPTDTPSWSFGGLLQANRIYTTLEPCAQCAGIMDLANLGSVIYAQDDPGQHQIVNVLYNMQQPDGPAAPLPIRAGFLAFHDELSGAYQEFVAAAPAGSRTGLTSFLETVAAYRIFRRAAATFEATPTTTDANAAVLRDARAFRARWRDSIERGLVPA